MASMGNMYSNTDFNIGETMKVPLFKPYIGKDELSALEQIFKTGWIGLGPKTAEFEKRFADYLKTRNCIGTNSATSALDLALKIFDFPEGEVLVPTITFVSTAHVVRFNPQMKLRFVDTDRETLCIDPEHLRKSITRNTKAVIPVHIGGQPCEMDTIKDVIEDSPAEDMKIIEDCANAAGGEYKGKKLGTIGDMGCFSFEAKKNMTTGDGGMIATNHEELVERMRQIRWCGINKDTWKRFSSKASYSWYYEINELGYKYNMNDIMAVIGIEQLKKLDAVNARKREIMRRYNEGLGGLDWLTIPDYYDLENGGYWLYVVKAKERDRFFTYLGENGITAGVHFMPVHLHPYYKATCLTTLPNAEEVWHSIVSLPLFYELTDEMIDYVITTIRNFK